MDDFDTGLRDLEHTLSKIKRPDTLNFSVLRHITEKFSNERIIGSGGSGHVYKGILPKGQIVAVKKLIDTYNNDDKMFVTEATTMTEMDHKNIVGFLGFCYHTKGHTAKFEGKSVIAEKQERLLCFEYITNGSLKDHITDELRGLEWEVRLKIITEICDGLLYLHKEKGIIHMDLKPENILLNDDFVPKIADFGIARLRETTKTMSENLTFTIGYCDPEYIKNRERTQMSDIYSLGVIIIEMITGANKRDPNIDNVLRRWRHRWNKSAKHTTLLGLEQVTRCLKLAQWCKNEKPNERPDIQYIIHELSKITSACMDIRDSCKSTVEQKKTFLEDMLGIEPLELHLSAEDNKQISYSIKLTNDTDDYIAFRILPPQEKNMDSGVSTITRLSFHLHRPIKDIIPPRSCRSVTITLGALKKPLQKAHCVLEIPVQSASVDKGLTAMDITEDIFKEEAGKVVDTVKLTVRVNPPKQLLLVTPLELHYYWPIEQNKLLPRLLQFTNKTDKYVAFMFILPRGKVLDDQAMGRGIMPPWSSHGVVIDMLVNEEALTEMPCKDTCLMRSVVVDKGLREDDVNVELFNKLTGVHDMELDIVFAEQPRAPSSVHRRHLLGGREDHESGLDKLELKGDRSALTRHFSTETELLHIYPAEVTFAFLGGSEYISLTNVTDGNIIYVINYDIPPGGHGYSDYSGVVPSQSTHAVLLSSQGKLHCQVRVMMISVSRPYCTVDYLYNNYTYDNREKLMNKVRRDGGKAHEALLTCIVRAPYPRKVATNKKRKVMVLHMDDNGLHDVSSMDVHPTEPWLVTGHFDGNVSIWKLDPEANTCETMLCMPSSEAVHGITSVKFIARMQWVACGETTGQITVYTYADDRPAETIKFQAHEDKLCALAVHPSRSYLLSSSKGNQIKLWDWDQGWKCTKKFSFSSTTHDMLQLNFNPKDAYSFASLDLGGEIKIWCIESDDDGPTTALSRGDSGTVGIAYCNTCSDRMATLDMEGKIEMLDLQSKNTHVHELKATGLSGKGVRRSIACHPTRPLVATAKGGSGAYLWNYATYGLKKVITFNFDQFKNVLLGFIDIKGFQRLVIARNDEIQIVDILDGFHEDSLFA